MELFFSGHFLSDLIFEDAWKWVGSFSLQFTEVLNWKWEASSKNKTLTYLVWRGSSASMGIIFYFLTSDFLIAFVMAWCQKKCSVWSVQYSGIKLFVTLWHQASAIAITNHVLGNEKWYLCWVFLVQWVLLRKVYRIPIYWWIPTEKEHSLHHERWASGFFT